MVITKKRHTKNFSLRRGYTHHAVRGSERKVRCVFCSRVVSKYKAVPVLKRFSSNIMIKEGVMDAFTTKSFACPNCAKIHHLKKQTETEKGKGNRTTPFHKKPILTTSRTF
ncbi:MAG: hypothetical protein CVU81_01410 [Euryarchaeota archaeon HGW-Euryarchaeota-1]|nr:MAG: hypothetical protein CVU81_01410 [Euryarchaeota archaeon HGW-Euryarchaeota-1]